MHTLKTGASLSTRSMDSFCSAIAFFRSLYSISAIPFHPLFIFLSIFFFLQPESLLHFLLSRTLIAQRIPILPSDFHRYALWSLHLWNWNWTNHFLSVWWMDDNMQLIWFACAVETFVRQTTPTNYERDTKTSQPAFVWIRWIDNDGTIPDTRMEYATCTE